MSLTELIQSGMSEPEAIEMLLNTVWTLVAACLVFFMQAGFMAVEVGFTRAKNASNIVMKNLVDFTVGSISFFFIGFALMFGKDAGGVIGTSGFFNPTVLTEVSDLPIGVFMIFQTVFCATAATIVSGSMAGRTKFITYCIFSTCISLFIYPVTGHWIWGGGWLSQIGFHDFAGSTAVHSVGGWCALVGAAILGPRIGKYKKDGTPNAIPGHNIPLGALGVFILWFCWFGFNCGSTTAATTNLGDIAMTTNLGAVSATFATLIFTWIRYGKPDVSMTLNGSLAGLVAITAGCDMVSNYSAVVIGLIAGILVVIVIEFVDKKLHIDDPVGATGVHWACGMIGTILTGVFAKSSYLEEIGMSRLKFTGIQILGVVAVGAYTALMAFIIFTVLNKTIGLRASEQDEIEGLDVTEHGTSAYADFSLKLH
ncbi:MAG: ammonium transporter [Lachnospiraceae bacterium]